MESDAHPTLVDHSDAVLDVLASVRAMRRLSPEPLPDELIERLVRVASWGPSAHNNQGQRFVVVTDRERMAAIAELWGRVVDWFLARNEEIPLPPSDKAAHDRMLAAIRYQREHFAETPAVIAACQRVPTSGGFLTRLRATSGLPWKQRRRTMRSLRTGWDLANAGSIFPCLQNLLIAARMMGVGATLTMWHMLLEDEFKKVLEVPDDTRIYALVPLGWPLGTFGPVKRREPAAFMFRERWENPWTS